jgi:hypothetical protein
MEAKQVTPAAQLTAGPAQDRAAHYANDLTAFMSAGQALLDGGQAINTEMLAFWQSRFKNGLETGQRLLECDSPQGALEIQLDYCKAALQAYLDQSTRVAGLMIRAFTDGHPKGPARFGRGSNDVLAA